MKSLFPPKDKFAAYMLGLYAADGYKRSSLRWSVFQNDEPFLDKIAVELNHRNLETRVDKKKSGWELVVNSKKDVDFLDKNGLGSNKTYFAGPVSIEREFFAYFLIGLIDGDGHIECSTNKPRIEICSAAKSMITWVVRYSNEIGITMSLSEKVRSRKERFEYPLFTARINDSADILRLLCLSIKLKGFVLPRKWDKLKVKFREYSESRCIRRTALKKSKRITCQCQFCGESIQRLATQARRYKPTCKACIKKRSFVTKTCMACKQEFDTTHHERRGMCRPCKDAEAAHIKQERQRLLDIKWAESCSHCGAELLRKEKNKSGIYTCREHAKYAHLYYSPPVPTGV